MIWILLRSPGGAAQVMSRIFYRLFIEDKVMTFNIWFYVFDISLERIYYKLVKRTQLIFWLN